MFLPSTGSGVLKGCSDQGKQFDGCSSGSSATGKATVCFCSNDLCNSAQVLNSTMIIFFTILYHLLIKFHKD